MTSGSDLTHLMVIESRLDPLVVADARALPEEADDRVAFVVARQSAVTLQSVVPALEQQRGGAVLFGRQDSARGVAQTTEQSHEVAHRYAPLAIDGNDPLAVV